MKIQRLLFRDMHPVRDINIFSYHVGGVAVVGTWSSLLSLIDGNAFAFPISNGMKIPQQYPQFDEKKTLICVLGTQEARFILADKGTLSELDQFKIEKPAYSDREGFFMTRAFGRIFGSGSVHEPKKQQKFVEFGTELEKKYKKLVISTGPDQLILTYPDYVEQVVKDKLPHSFKGRIFMELKGNFYKEDPLEILKKIQSKMGERIPTGPMSDEAKKILERGQD